MGYDYTYDHDSVASHISHEYPQSLLRIGMFENWFEARVSWSQLQDTDRVFGGARTTVVGSEDMDVGFKIALTPQQGWLPKTGLVVESILPTGLRVFTSGKMLPAIEYIYEWQVTKNLQVDGLTFLARDADDVTNESFLSTYGSIRRGGKADKESFCLHAMARDVSQRRKHRSHAASD